MKPLLLVLLAASLVANVVLGVMARRSASASSSDPVPPAAAAANPASSSSAPGQAGTAPTGGKPTGGSSATASAPVGAVWRAATTEEDLHRTVADLRAAGYPPDVVRAVVNHLLKLHFASREPNAGKPFWKQGAPTPETVAAQAALNNDRRTLFEALLGPDARPSAMLEGEFRERRYGTLSDDKIDALAKIERDYSEMSAEAWAKRRNSSVANMETSMQTQQLMEKEKLADMAAVLTPEELAQYEMRNSPSARQLMNNLRNVDITEAEYNRLYQAQKAFDEANPRRANFDATSYAQRQTAQQALNEQTRTVLGDERFYSYLEGADNNYANTSQVLTKYPAVTPATTYKVYQLQVELQSLMNQGARGGAMSPDKIAEMRTTVESYNARLEALIGAEAAEAYRKQGPGRAFAAFRSMPRPAPTGG
jgi:hypothetical protein